MTEVYRFSEPQLLLFFLLMIRMTAFVVSWPVFGVQNVPQSAKVLLGAVLAMMLFSSVRPELVDIEEVEKSLILLSAREAFIGVIVGFLGQLFFFAFRVSGELISQAMGLSAAQIFNPTLGGQSTPLEQFYVSLASLFFLAMNGHYYMLQALVETFRFAPLGVTSLNLSNFSGIGAMVQTVVEIGLKISAPILISILMLNLVLGVVGKTVPQLNVLVTSFPINILAGLTLLVITLPLLFDQMGDFLEISAHQIFRFVRTM